MAKTATIKLRLTEDEKRNWEAQAEAEGIPVSRLIRQRVNHPVTRADGQLDPAPARQGCPANGKACNCTGACMRPVPVAGGLNIRFTPTPAASAPWPVPTDVARRDTACAHGRPTFVFCPTCDAT